MRILGLLNSNVHGGKANIPADDLFPRAMQAPLAKAVGEPVEIVAHALWPNPGLHRVVHRWLDEFRPDLVVFSISSFWFLYESTPVKVERRFGRPGRFISQRSQQLAATPWLAHNRLFQWGRKHTQRLVGGRSWFEPDDVIARATEVIREVVQREGNYLVVLAPGSGERWAQDEAGRLRAVARRETVDAALASVCRHHHVEYVSAAEMDALRDPRPRSLQGDELHLDREGHRRVAQHYFEVALGWSRRAVEARDAGSGEPEHIMAEHS